MDDESRLFLVTTSGTSGPSRQGGARLVRSSKHNSLSGDAVALPRVGFPGPRF